VVDPIFARRAMPRSRVVLCLVPGWVFDDRAGDMTDQGADWNGLVHAAGAGHADTAVSGAQPAFGAFTGRSLLQSLEL